MADVQIISRRMVMPEPTLPPALTTETIHLTPWDLNVIAAEYIQKGVLLPNPGTGGQPLAESLASSLARALGRFYPFAGRLAVDVVADADGESERLATISLRCTGEGAEFVHAVAPDVTVADVADPLYVPRLVRWFFPLDGVLGVNAGPVLAAQVTELADGVFVAMSLNHGVADGTTFWHLFNTWSEISRRCWRSGGGDEMLISTPLPVFDRWFLDSCPVPIPLPLGKLEECIAVAQRAPAPAQECFLHFSAESVMRLKAQANTEVTTTAAASGTTVMPFSISSLQAVLAHLWRAECRARGLANEQETACAVAVGCRGRVADVPATYAGNAVSSGVARAAAGEILDQGQGLGRAARLLNRAVAAVDERSEREKVASWAQSPRFLSMQAFVGTGWLVMASSPRFNAFGNDFGWGAPLAVRGGSARKADGVTMVHEGSGGPGEGGDSSMHARSRASNRRLYVLICCFMIRA